MTEGNYHAIAAWDVRQAASCRRRGRLAVHSAPRSPAPRPCRAAPGHALARRALARRASFRRASLHRRGEASPRASTCRRTVLRVHGRSRCTSWCGTADRGAPRRLAPGRLDPDRTPKPRIPDVSRQTLQVFPGSALRVTTAAEAEGRHRGCSACTGTFCDTPLCRPTRQW